MILLDTNVLSELMRPKPEPTVVLWISTQRTDDLCISSITMAEILHGVAHLPKGQRQRDLHESAMIMFEEDFGERILPFDTPAALYYAHLMTTRGQAGRPMSMADAQIAAICRTHDAALATRNIRDFEESGVDLINPWRPLEI
ncbi:type II toxin-antitoxin system VapC family toxin [Pseudomonas sp. MF4836]|uniref:type II toxin-antitoxin system VapC family toxin n=1 Tax=Pseudomonas sp. MF4836 TaxID=1960827 RepID=UPI000998B7A4|nr:type II toxin-antitoxin system VapC family toxin [Pseudomonas sp. MF4836]OOV99428.1 VapC toxin family PIN domain ribonuclease [Pseudomonas sp. MF4836]